MPAWMPRLLEAARIVLQFALVIVLAFLVSKLAWLVIAPGPTVSGLTPRALPVPVAETGPVAGRADLGALMTTNPFEADGAAPEDVPDAPATQLNLKLVALFMSTGEGEGGGSATIVTPDNQARRYEPGDQILPGVRLERILADRVIISREGAEEAIMRSGREAGLSVIGDPATGPVGTARSSTPLATFAPGVTAQTLMASLDPVPETEDGRVVALTLQPRADASLMRSAGLEPGDRLVEVNGTEVAELDMSALAAEFGSARRATVTVIRDGTAQFLEIRFEEG